MADLPRKEMDSLTRHCRTKADKIRALARAGIAPAGIARFLGIRYQHAYNVMKRSGISTDRVMDASVHAGGPGPVRVTLDSFGRITIPDNLRDALGISAGDDVLLALDGEELRVFTRAAGLRVAQNIVSRYVRSGDTLSAELIGDRRREVTDDRG